MTTLTELTFQKLEAITNGFSAEHKVGSGCFGEVYKGVLDDGTEIAIKKLYPMPALDDAQFEKEFNNLMKVRHKNIIRLIAYCFEIRNKPIKDDKGEYLFARVEHRALCFEYFKRGSLDKHLSEESCGLDWNTRYKIIKGICEGLDYLHNGSKERMYHLDLKPGNILLDDNFIPKIADFGLSRLFGDTQTHTTRTNPGTFRYMPPEYIDRRKISNKFDVFSLGIVIIEIMAGPSGYSKWTEVAPERFIEDVKETWKKRLQATSSYTLISQEADNLEVKTCVELALRSVEADQKKRPTIREIVDILDKIDTVKKSLTGQNSQCKLEHHAIDPLEYMKGAMLVGIEEENILHNRASMMPADLTYHKLEDITNGFSKEYKVGSGAYGEVYKGVLDDGTQIAVKKLYPMVGLDDVQLKQEFNNLKKVRHKNIIRLIDFCYEIRHKYVEVSGKYVFTKMEERALCFEYFKRGSLDTYLSEESCGLDWNTRYKIIKGICEGLDYLHNGSKDHVYHLDLKPGNILLDDNFIPKIADFGLSRLFGDTQTHTTRTNPGTFRYMPPEYIDTRKISNKFDVFSLGIVIIEIMAGPSGYSKWTEVAPERFIEDVKENWKKRLQATPSCTLISQEADNLEVETCIELALRSVEADQQKRPTIREVVDKLDKIHTVRKSLTRQNSKCKLERLAIDPLEYMKGVELLGIEEAVNELMKILTEGNEVSTTQGKIVSIVGLGGLGKTTLAHAIYRKLRAQFHCSVFVSVSQNPNTRKLFKCMLYQLGKKNCANIHEEILDERLLIYELAEFLQNRRYFIVIDDIQDILIWKMIECALPANNGGCIIVTTTRISDVAKQVGGAYRMRHLCLEDSRILLHRRIFGTEDKGKYVDDEFFEISEKILERCSGIPLAIIMISGLLASKGRNKIEWDKVYRSMEYSGPEEKMKTIVSLCYQDLPSYLKNCLLYLSVFPKGYDIDKDHLIRLWIGEGLIQCGKQDESPFGLGESYFQELINRCMIQPVYKRWYYDMTECCHVHDMVLDLISEVTGKEKLVSVWNHMNRTFHSQEVQWLSLQNSMLDHVPHRATLNMQGVRSVVVFPSAVKLLPDLASFRDLLVLDLQSCCLSQGCSLKHIGNLVHLQYLGLRDTGINHLPEEVGNLQSLQTLDVRRNEISSLPSTVNELKHLVCLHIDSWTRAPNGIGSFTSLEELSTLCIQDSTDVIEELGNLTELRVLGIDCCTEWNVSEVEKSLVDCLHKLQKIKTLSISMVGECNLDAWIAPQHLRRLELTGCWPSTVPAFLNNPSPLLELSFLSIEVRKLRQEDLESLGRLPALSYLDIEVSNQKLGNVQTLIIGARYFPCLVHCTLRGYIGPVAFQKGAMPEVARLHLAFPVREIRETSSINGGGFGDLSFGNLPRLKDVSFLLRRGGASKTEVEEAEAALRQAIESHPNHPTLEIL